MGRHLVDPARLAGIRNVVWASSETVLGLPFETPPPYVPVDEEYAARPETSYSLAKHLDEQMAAQFARWDPQLKIIGLRFSNVMEPQDYERFQGKKARITLREPVENQRYWEGTLVGYGDGIITLDAGGRELRFPFEQVEKANLKFEW